MSQQPESNDPKAPRVTSAWMNSESWLRKSKKLGIVAMHGIYATRRFLNSEIAPSEKGFIPTLISPEDDHTRNLRQIDKLRNMIQRSNEVLVSVNTVFPLTLFVDSVIVDRTKVTIIYRTFFFTARTISIRIEDILNVTCSVGPFFGSVVISSRVMNSTDHFEISRLWRNDAITLKHIIQGYMITIHNDIDTDQLNREELIEHLTELGHEISSK